MKKAAKKTLSLRSETVRTVQGRELIKVSGAAGLQSAVNQNTCAPICPVWMPWLPWH